MNDAIFLFFQKIGTERSSAILTICLHQFLPATQKSGDSISESRICKTLGFLSLFKFGTDLDITLQRIGFVQIREREKARFREKETREKGEGRRRRWWRHGESPVSEEEIEEDGDFGNLKKYSREIEEDGDFGILRIWRSIERLRKMVILGY